MIKKITLGGILLLLCIVAGCSNRHGSGLSSTGGFDSLAAARTDSLSEAAPWLVFTYAERQGKHLFDRYCAICHGQTGGGDGFNSFNLDPKPHDLDDSAYVRELASTGTLQQVISLGGRAINKSNQMPAYQYTLTPQQKSDVAAYILTLSHHARASR